MTGWLLDTNVLSELRRPRPNARVVGFVSAQPLEDLYVSSVTFAEIRFGIELVADATRRADLNHWLAHALRPTFENRVLPVSEDVMFKWRLLVRSADAAGTRARRARVSAARLAAGGDQQHCKRAQHRDARVLRLEWPRARKAENTIGAAAG